MEPTKDNTTGTAEVDDFEDKDPDDCYCESHSPYFGSAWGVMPRVVYESGDVARKGTVLKVDNLDCDTLYSGSTSDLPMTLKVTKPFFLTPSIGMASIFCGRPTDDDIRNLKRQYKVISPMINRQYLEWNKPEVLAMKEPLKQITVIIEGAPEIDKPIHMTKSGFIYVLKLTPEYREMIHKSSAMSPNEFFIPPGNTIKFSEKISVTLDVRIIGRPRPQSWGPLTNPIKYDTKEVNQMSESYIPLSEFDHFFQEAKLKSKARKELNDSDFALVYKDASGEKIRKYPINDEAHVKAAARMFPRGVPNKYRKEVAGKILRRAHKFGIDTEGWKSLNNANKD